MHAQRPQADTSPQALHTVQQACALLGGISRTLLYELIGAGRVRVVKLGARTMVPDAEIRRIAAGG